MVLTDSWRLILRCGFTEMGGFFPDAKPVFNKKNGISFVDKFNCLMASFELGIIYYTAL